MVHNVYNIRPYKYLTNVIRQTDWMQLILFKTNWKQNVKILIQPNNISGTALIIHN